MRRALPWILGLSMSACVRLGFSPEATPADAAADVGMPQDLSNDGHTPRDLTDATSSPDAPPDLLAADGDVDPLGAFSNLVAVTELNSAGKENEDPSLTADMLEIYFSRDGYIMRATRANTQSPWGGVAAVTELNSGGAGTADISADGLTIYFSSLRADPAAKGGSDLYVATRSSRTSPFSGVAPVTALNTSGHDFDPAATSDGMTLVWAAGVAAPSYELFTAKRTTAGNWSPPQLLPGASNPGNDASPWVNADVTVLFLASDRQGGSGPRSIWAATRASASVPFGNAVLIQSLTSQGDDQDPWLSKDLRTIYFASDRAGTKAIYMATR